MGDNAAGGFLVTEDGNGMARTAEFKGPGVLEVLALQKVRTRRAPTEQDTSTPACSGPHPQDASASATTSGPWTTRASITRLQVGGGPSSA